MQKFKIILSALAITILTSCSGHSKKVLIFASSDIQLNDKNIKVSEGTTHHEQTAEFNGDKITLSVQSPAGNLSFDLAEDGLYILNLKNDTVVGSFQRVGAEGHNKITQDELKQKVDSLQQLILGKNISAANKNYFIAPNKIAKITTATNAKIFGPYTTIPASFDAGSVPEIYKFYTNREVKEIIEKLSPMIK